MGVIFIQGTFRNLHRYSGTKRPTPAGRPEMKRIKWAAKYLVLYHRTGSLPVALGLFARQAKSIGRIITNSNLDRESDAFLSLGGKSCAPLRWITFYYYRRISRSRFCLQWKRDNRACWGRCGFSSRFYDILEKLEENIPKLIPLLHGGDN